MLAPEDGPTLSMGAARGAKRTVLAVATDVMPDPILAVTVKTGTPIGQAFTLGANINIHRFVISEIAAIVTTSIIHTLLHRHQNPVTAFLSLGQLARRIVAGVTHRLLGRRPCLTAPPLTPRAAPSVSRLGIAHLRSHNQ